MTRDAIISIQGSRPLLRKLGQIPGDAFGRRFFAEISEYAIVNIQQRTLKGKDADGKAFAPYSPKYKLFRAEKGRQSAPVNLFFHGDMFNSMTYKSGPKSTILFFANTSDREGAKNPKKAFFLQQKRKFFALSQEDIDGIMTIARKYVRRIIDGS
jgi:hypothetical protein